MTEEEKQSRALDRMCLTGESQETARASVDREAQRGMLIGGSCFVLVLEPALNVLRFWKSAGQFDWLVDDATLHPREVRAVEELGEIKLHGMQCTAYLCDDGRARALPMTKNNKGEAK